MLKQPELERQCPACEGNPSGENVPCAVCGSKQDIVMVPRKTIENAIERMDGMILQIGMEFGNKTFDELREEGDEDLKAADDLRTLLGGTQ